MAIGRTPDMLAVEMAEQARVNLKRYIAYHSKRHWERVWCCDFPLNLGGNHAVQDNRTTTARSDGASRLRGRTNRPRSTGNYTNGGRRNQTADRDRRAAPFQSGAHHSSAE